MLQILFVPEFQMHKLDGLAQMIFGQVSLDAKMAASWRKINANQQEISKHLLKPKAVSV